jgi:excisionase family DNA binding protein
VGHRSGAQLREDAAEAVRKTLPDPEREPVLSVSRAGEIVGLSRNAAYAAVARGELPSLRFGRKIVVPTHALLELLTGPTQ